MPARRVPGAILALAVAAGPVDAQSLGDLARQEEARRATAKKAARSFSNGSLAPGEAASPSGPSPSCYMSISEGRCLSAEEVVAKSQSNTVSVEATRQEPTIRQEAVTIRAEMARLQSELDGLARTAADESRPAAQRAAAADALAKRQPLLEHVRQRWTKLEKYVERQRLPHQWIEPVPELATRNPQ